MNKTAKTWKFSLVDKDDNSLGDVSLNLECLKPNKPHIMEQVFYRLSQLAAEKGVSESFLSVRVTEGVMALSQ